MDVAPRLRSEGWRIDVEPGFGPTLAEADGDIAAEITEGSGIDWFEFNVGVSVDGQRVNLLPQLVPLLQQGAGHGFDGPGRDGDTLLVPLPDGRLLPVAYAKVKPILLAIEELFRVELAEGEPLALKRARAGEIAAAESALTDGGIAWAGGEALLALGRRLREVGPVAAYPVPEGFAADLRPYQAQGLLLAAVPGRGRARAGSSPTTWASARRCRRWRTSSPRRRAAAPTRRAWSSPPPG